MEFTREMLKDQLHLCKTQKKTFETMLLIFQHFSSKFHMS
jgi:hypothetical protein